MPDPGRNKTPLIPLHDDNPTTITPFVSIGFIVLCIAAFTWQMSLGAEGNRLAVYSFGLVPAVLTGQAQLPAELSAISPIMTVLSSMFLHGGFMHLAGNMLYLWIFGNNVEDAMGHIRFVIFYVVCGAAAALLQTLQQPSSTIPMIGASGAISGVLGAYLLLHPRASVLVVVPLGFIMPLVRLPAGIVLGFWFVFQIISSAAAAPGQPGVAWFAHIGGFVVGAALIPFVKYRRIKLFG